MMNNRIAVRIVSRRTRSWDHRKLGIAAHAGRRLDRTGAAGRRRAASIVSSPDGIRTHATAVRGRRPRPLDDGARTDPGCQHSSRGMPA